MTAPLHVSEPAGSPRGGLVVIQEAFGLTAHIRDVCDRFAAAGYLAVAPALFHRDGSPMLDYGEIEKARPHMAKLTAEGILADVDDATARIGDLPTGIVGYCMGGTVAFHVATQRGVAAAVTYYGGGVAQGRFGVPPMVDAASRLKAPWLGLFGDRDKTIPVDDVEQLRAALAGASVPASIVRYPDAQHGFSCDDRPAVFHAEASADAWARTFAFFEEHLR